MYQDAIRYGGFDLTYEGLKYGTQWVQAKWGEQFWSYLWGIEILFLHRQHTTVRIVLILPMRDWNSLSSGLKSISISPFWSYLWGIEIAMSTDDVRDVVGFDLTYEGLKLVGIAGHGQNDDVLILPMRDWNSSNRYLPNVGAKFWSYLWGIEIRSSCRCWRRSGWFWSYLWGIEISKPFTFFNTSNSFWSYLWGIEIWTMKDLEKRVGKSFDLTYEGLKWSTKASGGTGKKRFWSYLWGIEITVGCYIIPLRSEFWSYLWGIEIHYRLNRV